ncbi:MAG: hypothetical protein ABI591_29815 [Kofleriaceae bacterium]
MSDEGLHRQVEDSGPNPQLVAMKRRIDAMQLAYLILFVASLVLLITNWQTHAQSQMHVLWAVSLGGAVLVRVIRQSMVAKYNSALMGGRPGPLS